MAHQPIEQQKWEGKASANLIGTTADQVWLLCGDFLGIHKWLRGIDTCELAEGVPGQPGCVRYVSSTMIPTDGSDEAKFSWAKEKLLSIDTIQRCITYEVIESNIGFNSYVATIKVVSEDQGGSKIEWSYVVDPIKGWKFEDFVSFIDFFVHSMAKSIEETLEVEASK
ncbi:Polyketide cyclase/dehydrase [Macleaya cordata]|uniref:Polyketide cyclase/dehydrase n=1 Tax=Macleaya cordata TaxID=56857 RepID=A0A200Q518_MACCD|nr:Polyketide cyclase/dehydrase [Macleaya cordata]